MLAALSIGGSLAWYTLVQFRTSRPPVISFQNFDLFRWWSELRVNFEFVICFVFAICLPVLVVFGLGSHLRLRQPVRRWVVGVRHAATYRRLRAVCVFETAGVVAHGAAWLWAMLASGDHISVLVWTVVVWARPFLPVIAHLFWKRACSSTATTIRYAMCFRLASIAHWQNLIFFVIFSLDFVLQL